MKRFTLKYVKSLYKRLQAEPGSNEWAGFDEDGTFRYCPMCAYWMLHNLKEPIPKNWSVLESLLFDCFGKYLCGFGNGWDGLGRTSKYADYELGYMDGLYCRMHLKPMRILK